MNAIFQNLLSNESYMLDSTTLKSMNSETYRILIVEDEMIIAMDLAYHLEDDGYDVIGLVKSGEDAVAMAIQTCPDVIIMDIDLPGSMDGIAAAKIIQKKILTKIIFASGHSDRDPRIQKILNEGIHPFVRKPYYGETLRRLISEL